MLHIEDGFLYLIAEKDPDLLLLLAEYCKEVKKLNENIDVAIDFKNEPDKSVFEAISDSFSRFGCKITSMGFNADDSIAKSISDSVNKTFIKEPAKPLFRKVPQRLGEWVNEYPCAMDYLLHKGADKIVCEGGMIALYFSKSKIELRYDIVDIEFFEILFKTQPRDVYVPKYSI